MNLQQFITCIQKLAPGLDDARIEQLAKSVFCQLQPLDDSCREFVPMSLLRKQMVEDIHAELLDRGEESLAAEMLAALEVTANRPSPGEWKQIFKHKKGKNKYKLVCCTRPALSRTRHGQPAWFANCKFRFETGPRKGKHWTIKKLVSKNPKKMPILKYRGRHLNTCQKARAVNTLS